MFGKNNDENTAIDEVMCTIDDLWPPYRQALEEQDDGKKVVSQFVTKYMCV